MDNIMDNKLKKPLYILLGLIGLAALIAIDQWVKFWVYNDLRVNGPIILIPKVLSFAYVENYGAAWGMMNGSIILSILPIVFAVVLLYLYVCIPYSKRYLPVNIGIIVLVAGAIGNRIDRSVYGAVQDFIYFEPIDFPLFNVADCYIVCSAIFMAVMLIFYYKDNDFNKGMFMPWKKA